jgi:hypothetical protein
MGVFQLPHRYIPAPHYCIALGSIRNPKHVAKEALRDSNSRRLSMKREPFQRFGGQGEICLALGNQEVNFICT